MGHTLNQLVIGIATIYCAYWLVSAVRNDYFRGSRRYGHRKISREQQPRLYWFNVFVMTIFFVLGLLFLGWDLIARNSLH
jgi:hypothetical protein